MPSTAALAALVVSVVWLVHTTAVDRLDISKLAVASLLAAIVWGTTTLVARDDGDGPPGRSGRFPVLGVVGICLAVASLLFSDFVDARVEGWAPWVVAGVLYGLVGRDRHRRVGGVLSVAAGLLAIVGIVQALGVGWFTRELSGFAGRGVMGTLGNPDLFGVCLAGVLPFALVRARRLAFAALSVAIVAAALLSGSRTAWIMLLPSVVVGVVALGSLWASIVPVLGLLAGFSVGLASQQVDLGERIADLTAPEGTAAGRIYLWRVNAELVAEAGPLGAGPEGFRRVWPWAQARYLADHPEDIGFHSDLRHAHADIVELTADWGWLGTAIGLAWLLRLLFPGLLRRRQHDSERVVNSPIGTPCERLAAYGAIVALLLGGLATPVLFQPPSLTFAAVAAGVLAPGPAGTGSRGWPVAAALAIALTLFWVGQRTVSEVYRTAGLRMEVANRLSEAREWYGKAVEIDRDNPLALVMYARSLLTVDPDTALDAATRAAEHLPTPSVYAVKALAAEAAGQADLAMESWALYRVLYPERDIVESE